MTKLKRGEIECPKCKGSGEINPPGTLNYPIACPDCSGTGKTRRLSPTQKPMADLCLATLEEEHRTVSLDRDRLAARVIELEQALKLNRIMLICWKDVRDQILSETVSTRCFDRAVEATTSALTTE